MTFARFGELAPQMKDLSRCCLYFVGEQAVRELKVRWHLHDRALKLVAVPVLLRSVLAWTPEISEEDLRLLVYVDVLWLSVVQLHLSRRFWMTC